MYKKEKIELFGVKIDNVTLREAVDLALQEEGVPCWVVTPNAVMLDACRKNKEQAKLLNRARLSLPDGRGVLLLARRQGMPLCERVAGIDFAEAEELLENVAFATVGDIMPLTDENRILVKEGIKRIRATKNIGMKALIGQCGLEAYQIDAFHFGFVLGPCINASGRLDTAKRALELFFETNPVYAMQIANELVVLNEERKELTREGVEV